MAEPIRSTRVSYVVPSMYPQVVDREHVCRVVQVVVCRGRGCEKVVRKPWAGRKANTVDGALVLWIPNSISFLFYELSPMMPDDVHNATLALSLTAESWRPTRTRRRLSRPRPGLVARSCC